MASRERYPTRDRDFEITVATERMGDGGWAVVANMQRATAGSLHVTPLPDPGRYVATEDAARRHGDAQARDWIEAHAPAA